MVANRHIGRIIVAVMAVAVALCLLATAFAGTLTERMGGTGVRMEYETALFDTDEIITVDILMDADTWNGMLSNAMSEEYYVCDVVVNGQRLNNVAIRPKGNTSLSAIAMDPDSDRFSLKLEFDHFVKGQTCFGLDKLILNNNYADATNMKEAVIYDMYRYLGADASLYNYAKVSVNGEYWGVYLALEAVEQSFMLRNYGTQDGELYKPDTMDMGGGSKDSSSPSGGMDFSGLDMSDFAGMTPPSGGGGFSFGGGGSDGGQGGGFGFDPGSMPDMGNFDPNNMPDMGNFDPGSMPDMGNFDPGSMPDMGNFSPGDMAGGGSRGGSSGADLNYTDDELDSYSAIWDGEVTKTGKSDHKKVVTALKNISEGTDLETCLDVDNVLRYMAVHTFAVNMDSLSGNMAHNYYLHEYDGQLNIIPWDYNLSFGGMSAGSSDGTSVVNDAIDTPFSATRFFDALLSNEEYLERYHAYLRQLTDEYVNGGRFDQVFSRIREQIDSLVETDPTAFYSYEEYENAVSILYETVKLRAESISGQLDGTIPSTDAGQRQNSSALIDASHLDIKAMGQFDMGRGSGDGREERPAGETAPDGETAEEPDSGAPGGSGQPQAPEDPAPSGSPGDSGENGVPGNFDPGSMPDMGNFDPNNMPDMGNFDPNNMPDMGNFDPNNMPGGGNSGPGGMPGSGFGGGMSGGMGGFGPGGMGGGTQPGQGSGTQPGQGGTQPGQDSGTQPGQEGSAQNGQDQTFPGGGKERPSSVPGAPGQSSGAAGNLILYGVCLLIMLAALAAVSLIRRRRYRR